jgi:SEC-C motif domain protein
MRSRYSAYVLGEREHLLRTWAPETRPAKLFIDPARRWLGLKIKATTRGQAGDTSGTVEFVARSKVAGRADRVHEVSEFRFDDEGWLYVSGVVD